MQKKDDLIQSSEKNIFLNIISSYVRGDDFDSDISEIDKSALIKLSFDQGLGGIMYKACKHYGIFSEKELKILKSYYEKSLFMCAARNETLDRISILFEESKIDFLQLKGAVIQNYYPSPELRIMSDIDFMIKEENRELAKKTLENAGISFKESNSYQDIYVDCNGVIIEIHHALWGYNLENTKLFSNLWNKENLAEEKCYHHTLSENEQYIFIISHLLKHFSDSGIGIRPLFDIWFFFKKCLINLDFSYIKSELSTFDALTFEKRIRNIVNCIFVGKEKNPKDEIIIDYLLNCKTHGVTNLAAANSIGEKSKAEHTISKIFPPLSYMKRRFRILKKIPILLPFFWIVRIFSLLFNRKRMNKNMSKVSSVNEEDRIYVSKVMDAAGIVKHKKVDRSFASFTIILLVLLTMVFCSIFFNRENINPDQNTSYIISEVVSNDIFSVEDSSDTDYINSSSDNDTVYDTINWKSGTYVGYLINGVPNGSGQHYVPSKNIKYTGAFVDGEYEGIGKIEYPDGSYYEGNFSGSQLNGEGTLYCANGDIINGLFTDGQPGGVCTYQYSDGNLFVGTMIEGRKHGEGTFYWINGNKYVGSYVNDLRHGYGVHTFSNGDECSGTWEKDFLNGYGVYIWNDGKRYEGFFENNILNDTECRITFPDGSSYVGEIKNGVEDGKGELTFANGDIAKGNFEKGFLNGEAEYYFAENNHWGKVIYDKGVIIKYILD